MALSAVNYLYNDVNLQRNNLILYFSSRMHNHHHYICNEYNVFHSVETVCLHIYKKVNIHVIKRNSKIL
jgi:hypothetical protein